MSGHNVAAALHTAMVRSIVWREAESANGPGDVLANLNAQLCLDSPDDYFATAFFGWFDPATNQFHYANAGHPGPFLQDTSGKCQVLGSTMPLLGVIPDESGADATVDVDLGSRLLAFSDGLIEVADASGRIWGTSEILTIFEADRFAELNCLLARLLARRLEVRGEGSPEDDVTVVLVEYSPTALQGLSEIAPITNEVT